MSFLQKLFGSDPETEKQSAFLEIEQQFKGDEINKAKASWLTVRGNDYAMSNKYNQAISDFEEALFLEQNRVTTIVSLGMAYSYIKAFEKAQDTLERAKDFLSFIENDFFRLSQEQQINYHLGITYYSLNIENQAIRHFEVSREISDKIFELKKQGKIPEQDWSITQIMWESMFKYIRGLPPEFGTRIEILGKSKNWNMDKKCDFCQELIGDADEWDIDSSSLGDPTRKYSSLFSICEQCYAREYAIYPQEERTPLGTSFFNEYSKLGINERNLRFIDALPKEFWGNSQVDRIQALSLFDFLLSGEEDPLQIKKVKIPTERITEVMSMIDEYTADAASARFSKRFKHKMKAKNGDHVFFYDSTIPDKLNRITHGELLTLGFRMFESLTDEHKNELRSRYAKNIFLNATFQRHISTCADMLMTNILTDEEIFKPYSTITMSFQVIENIGLLKYLHWLRKAQVDSNLTDWAKHYYPIILEFK